jgi:hypothetical protein
VEVQAVGHPTQPLVALARLVKAVMAAQPMVVVVALEL